MILQTTTGRAEHPEIIKWCRERDIALDLISGNTDNRGNYVHTWAISCSHEALAMFCLRWSTKIMRIPTKNELEKR